ncbi:hypothetical protein ARMSODRAFT_1016773 [Armillaria solidipes]|uniref:Uncharacterized protein n=1 Tax=Armillaria solidipes TaxID=1076256 RepID=A0A2H3BLP2_9AGAR|nr:hypothetical protein ARMSODRAFT_1016773 [Armillaria solidipes]
MSLPISNPNPNQQWAGQRRPSMTTARSSDEFLQRRERPTCNAIPGPSNEPRAPSPLERPTTAEEYGRDLRSRYHSPSPLPYPTEPARILANNRPRPRMDGTSSPSPAHRSEVPPHVPLVLLPPPGQWVDSPTTHEAIPEPHNHGSHPSRIAEDRPREKSSSFATPRPPLLPLPEPTTTPSMLTALTTSGPSSPLWIDRSLASTAPKPGSYEDATSRIATDLEKMTESPWTGTWPSTEATPSNDQEYRRRSPQEYLPTESEQTMGQQQEMSYMANTKGEIPRNSMTWRSPYMHLPYDRETTPTWMESNSNQFDNFNYDYRMFSSLGC